MAKPTIVMDQFPFDTLDAAVDSATKRKGVISGEATIDIDPFGTNRLDFGIIDISGGTADSIVTYQRLYFSADGGNTLVEDFELFLLTADYGFSAPTNVQITEEGLASSTEGAGVETQLFHALGSPVRGDYTWTTLWPTEQSARNLRPPNDGTSMVLSTTSDDAIMWASIISVDGSELTGTCKDADAGKEFRPSITSSYS